MEAVYMWRKVHQTVLSYSQIEKFIDEDLKNGLKKSKENRHNGTSDDWDKVQRTVRHQNIMLFFFLTSTHLFLIIIRNNNKNKSQFFL